MSNNTAEMTAMRRRHDAITAEMEMLLGDPSNAARVWAIENEIDNMHARLDQLGVGEMPGGREWQWVNGAIATVEDEGDHMLLAIRLSDGSRVTASTVIEIEEDDHTFEALQALVGKPGRLRVGRLADDDRNHPDGIDRSLPVLDAIIVGRTCFPHPSFLREVA